MTLRLHVRLQPGEREIAARGAANPLQQAHHFNRPVEIQRQKSEVQHHDGHEAADDAVDDERDIAAERHDAQRDHGAHPEGREHQGGRHIARDFDHHTRSLR
ncbi:MAG: hypothetical protein ACXWU0_06130 [Rhodoplanes sp.]